MRFSIPLLKWYRQHKRDLPWRQTQDPYRILISEVMLQQTQVQTVIPYYHRFIKTFPSFKALANASEHAVLKLWEGLGYYSRARNLHKLAKKVCELHEENLPSNYEELISLPGIGRYTAGAILSIAFDKPFPLLDGNVQRVFARLYAIDDNLREPQTIQKLWTLSEELLDRQSPGDYNQALMELGATICIPKNPKCLICPIQRYCKAFATGQQNILPVKSKAKPIPHYHIGAGVIWKKGEILISQRPSKGLLGGLWEFAGGKQETGESITDCVQREIKEELGISVKVQSEIATVDHAYTHFKITLHAHECKYISGTPKTIGCQDWKWIKPHELRDYAFPSANQPIIEKILKDSLSQDKSVFFHS